MTEKKCREFGEIENRDGERRTCMPVNEGLCEEKHKSLKEIIDHRFKALDDALTVRTTELERRLAGLNELRNEVTKDRDQFVKKDTYDLRVGYYDKYIDDTRKEHLNLVSRVTVIETRTIVWTSVLGVAFTLLQIILHFYPKT